MSLVCAFKIYTWRGSRKFNLKYSTVIDEKCIGRAASNFLRHRPSDDKFAYTRKNIDSPHGVLHAEILLFTGISESRGGTEGGRGFESAAAPYTRKRHSNKMAFDDRCFLVLSHLPGEGFCKRKRAAFSSRWRSLPARVITGNEVRDTTKCAVESREDRLYFVPALTVAKASHNLQSILYDNDFTAMGNRKVKTL